MRQLMGTIQHGPVWANRVSAEDQFVSLLILAALAFFFVRRRWRGSQSAFGTAEWMSDKALKAAGMLGRSGLVLGRTFGGALIRLPEYTHVLACGGTGSGKGVSIVIPNLLAYSRGSIVCFDTKGDLYETAALRRGEQGDRIIRLAPFNGGEYAFNPLDAIPRESPTLVDSAHALAAALVVRQETETDPHWNDKAIQLIRAALVLVLLRFEGNDRSLNSVQEIISDRDLLRSCAEFLRQMGGIPARLGNQVRGLFDRDGVELTKEGAGVVSTATRHLSFLDSEMVAKAVSTSSFDPASLCVPGTTLFIQIPPDQLEAQKGLLRCWVSTLVRVIGAAGSERDSEVLLLIDEASALGNSLPALEEALVRGRSAGVRMLLAYQSDSQVMAAFKDKPTLLYDNCSTQIYLGAAGSIETAERLSKSLGEWTQTIESYNENQSYSYSPDGTSQSGGQYSRGSSLNYSQTGRALLRPEEILTLHNDCVIVLQRGMSPILADRVKWYADPDFNPALPRRRRRWPRLSSLPLSWRLVLFALICAAVLML